MVDPSSLLQSPARLRRALLLAALGALVIWLAFFDSHSFYKRVRWHTERAALQEENEALRDRIQSLRGRLEDGLSDDVVEQIAREQYGMRRPGETVYRVEEDQ